MTTSTSPCTPTPTTSTSTILAPLEVEECVRLEQNDASLTSVRIVIDLSSSNASAPQKAQLYGQALLQNTTVEYLGIFAVPPKNHNNHNNNNNNDNDDDDNTDPTDSSHDNYESLLQFIQTSSSLTKMRLQNIYDSDLAGRLIVAISNSCSTIQEVTLEKNIVPALALKQLFQSKSKNNLHKLSFLANNTIIESQIIEIKMSDEKTTTPTSTSTTSTIPEEYETNPSTPPSTTTTTTTTTTILSPLQAIESLGQNTTLREIELIWAGEFFSMAILQALATTNTTTRIEKICLADFCNTPLSMGLIHSLRRLLRKTTSLHTLQLKFYQLNDQFQTLANSIMENNTNTNTNNQQQQHCHRPTTLQALQFHGCEFATPTSVEAFRTICCHSTNNIQSIELDGGVKFHGYSSNHVLLGEIIKKISAAAAAAAASSTHKTALSEIRLVNMSSARWKSTSLRPLLESLECSSTTTGTTTTTTTTTTSDHHHQHHHSFHLDLGYICHTGSVEELFRHVPKLNRLHQLTLEVHQADYYYSAKEYQNHKQLALTMISQNSTIQNYNVTFQDDEDEENDENDDETTTTTEKNNKNEQQQQQQQQQQHHYHHQDDIRLHDRIQHYGTRNYYLDQWSHAATTTTSTVPLPPIGYWPHALASAKEYSSQDRHNLFFHGMMVLGDSVGKYK